MKKVLKIARGEIMHAVVQSRETTLYNGNVSAMSSVNNKGPFDVLPRHIHFITVIKDTLVIQTPEGEIKQIPFDHGIMKVKDKEIEVYIGTGKQ